ncbi:hypothetical protein J8M21_25965 [Pseudoalteromonas luteoviolacea]|uniref:hypothetical protein n=1 Tax=Pseudoalteromonas luteoviolacea TaxID=43657 RepID=UPI001B3A6D39|nr:hypothetical protein [Pseudoalteromonas luteoviolacea]MBQ4880647.1 hypothetical protein [Pseudoalteromonas luteoviolacea]MBQ4909686.1 hypothetical protein [Pseudoalteromonas luteoviolacea]
MKLTFKIVAALVCILFSAYHTYFFALPSVTVINNSKSAVESARVNLPSSGLDFGPINAGSKNTIYYALEQSDGVYQYQFKIESGLVLSGKCGYVTNNEVHKRVVLLVKENQVTCQSST